MDTVRFRFTILNVNLEYEFERKLLSIQTSGRKQLTSLSWLEEEKRGCGELLSTLVGNMTSESGTYKLTRPFSNFSKTFLLRAFLRFPTEVTEPPLLDPFFPADGGKT